MITMSPVYNGAMIKGITLYPDNPLKFDFIIDQGDSHLNGKAKRSEYQKLIKYFLASLTVPEEDLWVNLSPHEKDRIIPDKFGMTEMGRDLLAQDYILKQLTASLIYPEDELGKKFWDKVYKKAYAQYGHTNISVNMFNKVWIVPESAIVFEQENTAYVAESRLKVMLEADYEAMNRTQQVGAGLKPARTEQDLAISSQIIREIIIPELEREVNEGKNFAQLRQIYNSLILAAWYKQNLKQSLLVQVYADKNKISGIDTGDKNAKQKIYDQYMRAFEKGVYNYIKEDYDPVTQETIPRKYFSGGFGLQLIRLGELKPTRDFTDLGLDSRTEVAAISSSLLDITTVALVEVIDEAAKTSRESKSRGPDEVYTQNRGASPVDGQEIASPQASILSSASPVEKDGTPKINYTPQIDKSGSEEYWEKYGDRILKLEEGYDKSRKLTPERLKKIFEDEDSLIISMFNENGLLVGYIVGGPVEKEYYRNLKGVKDDENLDKGNTFYTSSMTVDAQYGGKRIGPKLKEAQLNYILNNTKFNFMAGRTGMESKGGQKALSINIKYGAKVERNYSEDSEGYAMAYYRTKLNDLRKAIKLLRSHKLENRIKGMRELGEQKSGLALRTLLRYIDAEVDRKGLYEGVTAMKKLVNALGKDVLLKILLEYAQQAQIDMQARNEFGIKKTNLMKAENLTKIFGVDTMVFRDDQQVMGSFKIRYLTHILDQIQMRIENNGGSDPVDTLVSYSTGNHAIATAYIARKLGKKALVFVSTTLSQTKRKELIALGAEIIEKWPVDDDIPKEMRGKKVEKFENARFLVERFMADPNNRKRSIVVPHASPHVSAGYGTGMLEIYQQLNGIIDQGKKVTILVPAGETGLAGGIKAIAAALGLTNVKVMAVSSEHYNSIDRSWKFGSPESAFGDIEGTIILETGTSVTMLGVFSLALWEILVGNHEETKPENNDIKTVTRKDIQAGWNLLSLDLDNGEQVEGDSGIPVAVLLKYPDIVKDSELLIVYSTGSNVSGEIIEEYRIQNEVDILIDVLDMAEDKDVGNRLTTRLKELGSSPVAGAVAMRGEADQEDASEIQWEKNTQMLIDIILRRISELKTVKKK